MSSMKITIKLFHISCSVSKGAICTTLLAVKALSLFRGFLSTPLPAEKRFFSNSVNLMERLTHF